MTATTTDRQHRRAYYLQALADEDLLDLHAETCAAAKEGLAPSPAEVFPEAEFDTWKEWSLALEAELDRRNLDHRKLNLQ
jgi:hypothetical protein